MKGKLNYLVIVGVSIILLLGIVTTAFGQSNSNLNLVYDHHLKTSGNDCSGKNVPLRQRSLSDQSNWGDKIGCIKPEIYLKNLGFFKDKTNKVDTNFVVIQAKSDHQFVINKNFLDCPSQEFCRTRKRK
ncbi:MAG: hypothetical protein F6K55_18510 [Moorea sp. SIO4A3]|nr:hypothetical protein [Moorena sp. SIO4A3]